MDTSLASLLQLASIDMHRYAYLSFSYLDVMGGINLKAFLLSSYRLLNN